jgi:hypothetical protein
MHLLHRRRKSDRKTEGSSQGSAEGSEEKEEEIKNFSTDFLIFCLSYTKAF